MTEPDVTALTHRLALLTRRAMGEAMATEDWAHVAGFRPGCIGVLRVVAAGGPLSQRQVSDALMMDPSDIVGLVDVLERAELIVRERDAADRRRYALNVTTKGQLAIVRLDEVSRDAGEAVLAPLTADERAQLAALLRKVVEHHAPTIAAMQDALAPVGPHSSHGPHEPHGSHGAHGSREPHGPRGSHGSPEPGGARGPVGPPEERLPHRDHGQVGPDREQLPQPGREPTSGPPDIEALRD